MAKHLYIIENFQFNKVVIFLISNQINKYDIFLNKTPYYGYKTLKAAIYFWAGRPVYKGTRLLLQLPSLPSLQKQQLIIFYKKYYHL